MTDRIATKIMVTEAPIMTNVSDDISFCSSSLISVKLYDDVHD